MLKKFLLIISILALALGAVSCGGTYPAVESTDEEKTVLMTFNYDGEKYELTYELYRALFLNNREAVDGGDTSVWESEGKAEYIEKIDKIITDNAAEIFSTLHHAKKIGINPYSGTIENKIDEYIKTGVESDPGSDETFLGFGGNYDEYLAHLKAMNLNYSAHVLMIRYAICYDEIVKYYIGTYDEENPTLNMEKGKLVYTENDVLDFYGSSDSKRVLVATFDSRKIKESRAKEIRDAIASKQTTQEVQNYIMGFTTTVESDGMDGVIIGRYSLDASYYGEYIEAAFELELFETSSVIKISTIDNEEYHILYCVEKSNEYYEAHKDEIALVYVNHRIGEILADVKGELIKARTDLDTLNSLNRSEIRM